MPCTLPPTTSLRLWSSSLLNGLEDQRLLLTPHEAVALPVWFRAACKWCPMFLSRPVDSTVIQTRSGGIMLSQIGQQPGHMASPTITASPPQPPLHSQHFTMHRLAHHTQVLAHIHPCLMVLLSRVNHMPRLVHRWLGLFPASHLLSRSTFLMTWSAPSLVRVVPRSMKLGSLVEV